MKSLFQNWEDITRRLNVEKTVLFLDYDGTLAPIAETPPEATLPTETKSLLEQLSEQPQCEVVIVSGRALADLKAMVGVKKISYIGNHGWEIDRYGISPQGFASPQDKLAMGMVRDRLNKELNSIPGVLVEDKTVTLSVHYRQVAEEHVASVHEVFNRICQSYCNQNQIKVSAGLKVLEVRPWIQWNKGRAAQWYLEEQHLALGRHNIMAIYVGDDRADEEVFKEFKDRYITVEVGNKRSSNAEFYLEDTTRVAKFLNLLVDWWSVTTLRSA